MRPIRVLHVLDTANWAGTEQHVLTLAAAQAKAGTVAPTLACPAGSPLAARAAAAGLDLAAIRPGATLRNAVSLRRVRGDFDLLHAHNGRSLAAAVVAGPPVVATQHFLAPASSVRGGIAGVASRLVQRRLARRCGRWVAVSRAARDGMVRRGDADADRIDVVPNGVPEPPAADGLAVRAVLGLAPEAFVVLCASRLEPEKDVPTLIDAAAKVGSGLTLLLAGDGSCRQEVERRTKSTGGDCRVLGRRDDVPGLMAAADVVALPAPAEPFGLALVEAMAAGRPTLACAAGGPLEIVEEGVTGLLVPPRDAGAMAAALERLAADRPLRRRMGCAARRRYESLFTAEAMERATHRTYRRVLDAR